MEPPETNRYQTGFRRLFAAIIDGIIFIPLSAMEQWIFKDTVHLPLAISSTIFFALLPLVYSIFLHYKYGQTLGKRIAGVKVLDISETRLLTLRQSVFRDGFYLIVEVVGLCYFLSQINKPEYLQKNYSDFAAQPIIWWTVIELVTMLTNKKKRAIHDLIAGSVVVRV